MRFSWRLPFVAGRSAEQLDVARRYSGGFSTFTPRKCVGSARWRKSSCGPAARRKRLRLCIAVCKTCPTIRICFGTWANLLISQGDLAEANEVVNRLGRRGLLPSRDKYLHAAMRFRRGDWTGARRDLEAVRPLLYRFQAANYSVRLIPGRNASNNLATWLPRF